MSENKQSSCRYPNTTPLTIAIEDDDFKEIRKLVEKENVNINENDKNGTPLIQQYLKSIFHVLNIC